MTEKRELATVTPLPVENTEVVDGEPISEEEYQRLISQRAQAIARWHGYRSDVVRAARGAKTVVTHQHTKSVVREAAYVGVGAGVVIRRVWDARTGSRYERMMRAAEAAGNWEMVAEWESRAVAEKQRRHQRKMDWTEFPVKAIKAVAAGAGLGFGGLLGLGIVMAVADKDLHEVGTPLMTAAHLVTDVTIVVGAAWGPLVLAAPWLGAVWLWRLGKRHSAAAPGWLRTSADLDDDDLIIDEVAISRALGALKISQISAYLKQGLPMQYLVPARTDGRGTHAVIRLPEGVPAVEIAKPKRRAALASALHRRVSEVWPTVGDEAGILDLWIADKGALAEGAGPYPLLSEGTVDVFRGVPLGRTLRGDEIRAPLMERNTITGGIPGQGKSSSARAILAGAALDPTAEIWVHVPDSNFDFELFKRRTARYVMGAEDDKIEQILSDLKDLHEEVQRRGQVLIEVQEPVVTRELADAGIGLHPLFYLLEEAHIAIQHRTYGKDISRLLIEIVKLGRKRGIHAIVSTQAPTRDSMPRDVTRNCSNGVAFAVGDHVANDALLGQGAYRAGHRATELIPGTDRGTAVCKGLTGERSDIVQVYFISIAKDCDQLTPIIDRAMDAIEARGKGLPGADTARAGQTRDLPEDLDEVLGTERVRLADLPGMLRSLAPTYGPYRGLTGTQLREQLGEFGIRVTLTGNVPRLDPADLRRYLAVRSTEDLDDGE